MCSAVAGFSLPAIAFFFLASPTGMPERQFFIGHRKFSRSRVIVNGHRPRRHQESGDGKTGIAAKR
jgi:hypothetical protein